MEITEEDVGAWIEMTDSNQDGLISFDEYETVVIKSLESAGFKVEKQRIILWFYLYLWWIIMLLKW